MKQRAIYWMVPALALGLGACGKKEQTTSPEATSPAEKVVEAIAEAVTPDAPPASPALSVDERAAKLGFVKHLPQDTEVVMAFHNGTKSAERITSSKIWGLVQDQMGMGMGMGRDFEPMEEEMEEEEDFALPDTEQDADAEPQPDSEPEPAPDSEPAPDFSEDFPGEEMEEMEGGMGPAALFGTEFTIALGKSASEQTGNLLTLNRRFSYFQMRSISKAFVSAVKSGDMSEMTMAMTEMYGPEFFKELLADSESGVGLLEKLRMPPLYLAFRTQSSDREAAAQQLASMTENIGMMGEMVEPVEVEKAGQKFAGYKIPGAKVSALMEEDRGPMDAMLDAETGDKIIAAVAKRDLVVLSGTIGDYVVLFFGASEDDLVFAADPTQSLVAGDALAFADAYASKELAAVIYGQKSMLDSLVSSAGGLADMANGIRDGLTGSEALGDTRDLETLLRMVGERESALRKLIKNESGGTVAFFEEGLKIESHGGSDNGALDWNTPNKLGALGEGDDVLMFANMTANAAYDENIRGYIEAIAETTYAMAMKMSELPMEDENMAQIKEMTKMFDETFRTDVVALWDALSGDFSSGLGNESAYIVDLGGSMPAIPGMPQAVVDEAKFPRMSMVAPVTDRAKLAGSWEKVNTSATGILGKISEMSGTDMPMQKPISSEKDGFTTWFFSMPFFNDDFMPSITVGDQWFAASSSKNKAQDLLGKAASSSGTTTGLVFNMNFNVLRKYVEETTAILEKNGEAMELGEEQLESMRKTAAAMEELDKLNLHVRRDSGELRTSIHFKTR